ncbi:MAG: desulfoferrodoxin family protein [Eubacterium sp.]
MKFYVCEHCGNIIHFVKDAGVPVMCCGEKMKELVPGITDAAQEKHVPVIEQDGQKVVVKVGSLEHPMLEEHYIEWIVLETKKGYQKVNLKPGDEPNAEFMLTEDDKVVAAYEFCNLHGLWKKAAE